MKRSLQVNFTWKLWNVILMTFLVLIPSSVSFAMPPGGWNPAGAVITAPANSSVLACNNPINFAGDTGNGTTFTWTFGDGTTASGQYVTHSYTNPGIYSVSLRVSGSQDGTPTQASTKTISLSLGHGGSVYPKFVILGLDYAPPGKSSYATYSVGTTNGSSHSFKRSLSNTVTVTAELGADFFGTGVSGQFSSSWTQSGSQTNTSSIEITQQASHTVRGPLDSNAGLNHDYDVVWLWLNPRIDMVAVSNANLHWTYNLDPADVNYANQADIQYVYLKWLKNPALMAQEAPSVAAKLARSWAGVGGALTSQDYATIMSVDPFWNGSSTVDASRFDVQLNYPLQYEPAPSGGQPITQTYSVIETASTTQTIEASASYTVGIKATGSIGFLSFLSSSTSIGEAITLTNSVTDQSKAGSTTTDFLSITGPDTGYVGPTNIRLYTDKAYGTYMFYMIY